MRSFKLIAIGLLSLLLSFFAFFIVLEVYKYTDGAQLFRAHNPYDLVIKNARIIDGAGGEIIRADIGIRDDKIIKIGNRLKTDGAKIFDAAGYSVAPNKVDWPEKPEWIKRDLASALVRYPQHRIIIAEAQDVEWKGKSIKALLSGGDISIDALNNDKTALAWITPQLDNPEVDNVSEAYYLLSGWRGELLGENSGKIKENFVARLVVFNHREINDDQVLAYLQAEKLPPSLYIIEGSQIQSTKTDS